VTTWIYTVHQQTHADKIRFIVY